MENSRVAALEILQKILEERSFLTALPQYVDSENRAFLNMLLRTVLRRLVFIKKTLKRRIKKMPSDPQVKYALCLGCCELLYLNTPDYAVLDSYVGLVKRLNGKYAAGFVNAVLRRIATEKESILAEDQNEFFTHEFFRILNQDYGCKTIRKIQMAALSEPPLDITCKEDPSEWAKKLGGQLLPNQSIRLKNNGVVEKLPGFSDGLWWVQDFSAALAVNAVKDVKGKKVLDICAAPGGKTAQLICRGAKTTAVDISEERLKKLRQNLQRLNLTAEQIIQADGIDYLKQNQTEKFDLILLDAPCSATGTFRRHPEIIHIKGCQDIENQIILQKAFLDAVSGALKPGGTLVYCTCSISKAEGEQQIESFLKRYPEFHIIPIKPCDIFGKEKILTEIFTPEGFIRTLPHHLPDGCDSFFIAKLRKGGKND